MQHMIYRDTMPTLAVFEALENAVPGAKDDITKRCLSQEIARRVLLLTALNSNDPSYSYLSAHYRNASDEALQEACRLDGDGVRSCIHDFMQDHGLKVEDLRLAHADQKSLKLDIYQFCAKGRSTFGSNLPDFERV